jgi:probable F420-dependent oxidoreductase
MNPVPDVSQKAGVGGSKNSAVTVKNSAAWISNPQSAKAREIARAHTSTYLKLPNYVNNLRRLGFGDEDLADGGSDKLVDAIVAWGDLTAIIDRVRAHQSAGADHVCIQVLPTEPRALPIAQWREMAAALLDDNSRAKQSSLLK